MKKLKIAELQVKSFITSLEKSNQIKGGTYTVIPVLTKKFKEPEYEITKRVVDGGCWASETTGPN